MEGLHASLRASQVPAFRVMEVMKAAHERERVGGKVLHMEVGQPSVGAPAAVLDAARASLDACGRGETTLGYTVADGTDALRRRIARHYADRYSVDVDEDAVMVTTGSSAAFVLGFIAAFGPGDRVAIATPGYPCYRNILEALGVEVVSIPVDAATNFQPTTGLLDEALKKDPRPLKGLIIASPSNPTGTVLKTSELFALHAWCKERAVWFVSDEIYHQIEYGEERATSALESPGAAESVLVINSFSKYHCMTGWRIGWCVVPPALRGAMRALQQNLFINAPTIAQHAALAAFDCDDELGKHVDRYRENRAILLEGLPRAGFTKLSSAGGAYYIYADVTHLTEDSVQLCKKILETTGVACVPGVDFDRERGLGFVRFSFANSTETAREAVRVLVEKKEEWCV
eukprot:CAMPEP_0198684034 /NCGR_PEP_ID=MMETSP1468-20131203/11597_1 /TAXON_ID=1461545 /ORGANISM="Mantoniella sp, Strain CCMP1436" /LENGTH=401 /DNA_ID=CAMNT_0044428565 /DNA_START=26 /DNA_END=1231 /DNA_ORIENTATION=+